MGDVDPLGDNIYFRTAAFEGSPMALDGWSGNARIRFGELEGRFNDHVVGGPHGEPLGSLDMAEGADVVCRAFSESVPTG